MRRPALPPKISVPRHEHKSRLCAAHRAWVRKHHCSVPDCAWLPIECAHVRRETDGGIALKPSDRWVISLCTQHHAEQHRLGERTFERKYGLDLVELAQAFANRSPQRARLIP